MKLYRVVFYDKSSGEHYNNWHTSEESAEKSGQKLISDGVTDSVSIDAQIMCGKGDRITLPLAVEFMNRHSVVNIDASRNNEMPFENDSMGG